MAASPALRCAVVASAHGSIHGSVKVERRFDEMVSSSAIAVLPPSACRKPQI